MGVRKVIRGFGKALICVGILLFLFVGYQLWGTGVAEARGQRELEKRFQERLLTSVPTIPPPSGGPATTTTLPPISLGDSVAQIEIPKIDVKKYVVEGVGVEDLKAGPGHYPGTPMPGEPGNSAIAGHRTTYGAPFYRVDELEPGDPIFVTTAAGRFQYDVKEWIIVDPEEGVWVLDDTPDDRLTLTTCHPRFSAAQRLIVIASLVTAPVEAAPRAPPAAVPDDAVPVRADLGGGLSGAAVSRTPAVMWGAFAAAIWLGGWLLGRSWRRWPAYALTAVPFLVVLFVFYENVARLLPANV
ncbi:MAG: class E sortase [Actinomycetota bacterium]|jgi:sortase A